MEVIIKILIICKKEITFQLYSNNVEITLKGIPYQGQQKWNQKFLQVDLHTYHGTL